MHFKTIKMNWDVYLLNIYFKYKSCKRLFQNQFLNEA